MASQFSGAYLGSATEYALIDLLPKVFIMIIYYGPNLVDKIIIINMMGLHRCRIW